MIIPFNLGAFLDGAVGPLAKKVLAGLGIGVISYGAVTFAFQQFIDLSESHYLALPSMMLNLLGLAGFGDAMGMLTGAILFRISYSMTAKLGVIPK